MHGGATGTQHLLLAETLGLAMARRASDILERHRATLTSDPAVAGAVAAEDDDDQFAVDNAIFTAVLDAANECLGRFDSRPADDRWCDALLQVIHLAQLARLSAEGLPRARSVTQRDHSITRVAAVLALARRARARARLARSSGDRCPKVP